LKPSIPSLAREKRIVMEDRVGLSRLYLNWHTVQADAPGDAELDLLASILAGGKASRLYRTLVLEKQIAQDVSAYQRSARLRVRSRSPRRQARSQVSRSGSRDPSELAVSRPSLPPMRNLKGL